MYGENDIPSLGHDGKQNPAYYKAWAEKNKEKIRAQQRARYLANREARQARERERYRERREAALAQKAEYHRENADKRRAYAAEYRSRPDVKVAKAAYMLDYFRKRRATDPHYRMKAALHARLLQALRLYGNGEKYASTIDLIGCTIPELVIHLENQFESTMSWENYGRSGWHIDHKVPCSAFDLTDPEQQKICFHYTNLQPMWGVDNIRKGGVRRK
jgi:hypothetical protein